MSDDLISREETVKMLRDYADLKCFNEEIELANGIFKAVCYIENDNIPTAYNIDKVIERLKSLKTDNFCGNCTYKEKCDELQEFYNPDDSVDLCGLTIKELALEIVKSGGVTND